MSVGASFLDLLGRDDPRKALLQAVAGANQPAGGAQYADPAAGGAGTTATAQAGGAGVQPPAAEATQPLESFKSPPDLSKLYDDLLKYNSAESNINRGFGLIGSSISQDANRADTLGAFAGDRPESDRIGVGDMATTIMELNKANIARQQRAATLASLPAIAQRYGLSLETARYLFDTGQLDKVISEEEKPNNEIVKDAATGQNLIIDKTGVKQLGTFGGNTPKELSATTLADGTVAGWDKTTGVLGDPQGPKKVPDQTTLQQNYDAYVTDEARRGNNNPMSFNAYALQAKEKGVTINNNAAAPIDPGVEAEKKKRGEKLGENYVNIQDASANASEQLNMYDAVEKGLGTGVRTGSFAESEQSLRKFGQLIGIEGDLEKIAGGELVTAIQNRMALQMRNPESGMGMPGSLSDKDIEFLKASQIGMGTSGPGNKTMLEVYRRLANRKIELANLADEYVGREGDKTAPGKGSMMGFGKYAAEYNKLHPLFDDLKVEGGAAPDDAKTKSLLDKWAPRK